MNGHQVARAVLAGKPADINEALTFCVAAIGGTRHVGQLLFPEKEPRSAEQFLRDCLNARRRERLAPDQLLHLFQLAEGAGYRGGIDFVLSALGLARASTQSHAEELAELLRQFIATAQIQAETAARIERAITNMKVAA